MINEAMNRVRDYIALIMTIAILLMVGLKVPIPDRIWDIYMMVIAFFFGSKSQEVNSEDLGALTALKTQIKASAEEVKP